MRHRHDWTQWIGLYPPDTDWRASAPMPCAIAVTRVCMGCDKKEVIEIPEIVKVRIPTAV